MSGIRISKSRIRKEQVGEKEEKKGTRSPSVKSKEDERHRPDARGMRRGERKQRTMISVVRVQKDPSTTSTRK